VIYLEVGCSGGQELRGGVCIDRCDPATGEVHNSETCHFVYPEGYLMLRNGYCIQTCTQDSDCGEFRTCDTTTEGGRVCSTCGCLPFCSPCTSTQGYQSGPGSCQAVNTCCSAIDNLFHQGSGPRIGEQRSVGDDAVRSDRSSFTLDKAVVKLHARVPIGAQCLIEGSGPPSAFPEPSPT